MIMGFRNGAYAKVWDVSPISDTVTKLRVSISRKDKNTGDYVDDFSGFLRVIGTSAAKRASMINPGDRIKLGDVDVSTRYDKEKKMEYTTYKVFGFELVSDGHTGSSSNSIPPDEVQVDSGEIDNSGLPF